MEPRSFSFEAIGVVRCDTDQKADAPRQGRAASHIEGRIELEDQQGFEDALRDIEGFDYLWVVSVFDRTDGWRPTVLPPRSGLRRGVFATRAPRRPNPLGLSAVRLLRREGLVLHVAELDLLDGTPVLDIKPYVPWADAIPESASGWLPRPDDPGERFEVHLEKRAEEALAFLEAHGVAIRARIVDHLAIGPRPHAYRRIRAVDEGFVLAVERWRVRFSIEGANVHVHEVRSGEKVRDLVRGRADSVHLAFYEAFG